MHFRQGTPQSSNNAYLRFIDRFDKEVGLDNIKFVHFNDSKKELVMHIDRHVI